VRKTREDEIPVLVWMFGMMRSTIIQIKEGIAVRSRRSPDDMRSRVEPYRMTRMKLPWLASVRQHRSKVGICSHSPSEARR